MDTSDLKLYGTSYMTVDSKNRMFIPAKYRIDEGTQFGFVKIDSGIIRAYLYQQLVLLYESLQKASYLKENDELTAKVCQLLLDAGEPRAVDKQGRISLPLNTLSGYDGLPNHHTNNVGNVAAVVGEGKGLAIISNEKTLEKYANGIYGCNIESYIRK